MRMLADDPAARRLNAAIAAPGPLTPALKAAGVRFVIADGGPDGGVPGLAGRLPGATVVAVAPGRVVYRLPGGPAGP